MGNKKHALADYLVNQSVNESEDDSVRYITSEFGVSGETARVIVKEYHNKFGSKAIITDQEIYDFLAANLTKI